MRKQLASVLVVIMAGAAISTTGADAARAWQCTARHSRVAGEAGRALPGSGGSGAKLWATRYAVPDKGGNLANAVAVSQGGGTVFVTGQSYGTTSGANYATVAYNATTGDQLWAARYNGPAKNPNLAYDTDEAYAVAVSPTGGTVFVTGQSYGTTSGYDYATVAYNATTGTRLWVARYNGPGNSTDNAHSVAVSPSGGTVFVTGLSLGTSYDYATVAYNATTGARLWTARYNGPGNSGGGATSVAVSPAGGTVYVTGYSTGANSGDDYATVAYNATTGTQQWATRYNGPGNGDDLANSMAVSRNGATLYVTGYSTGANSGYDYATVAYDATTGTQHWAVRYNGPGNGDDLANSVAVSPNGGTVYVTGQSTGATSGYDYATVAYNATTGTQQWATRYNGPGNNIDNATSVAVSSNGATVYVTGQSIGTPGYEYATVAYNATTGTQHWATRYSGPRMDNLANALAVNPITGTVYVTGESEGSSGWDYLTVAYRG